MTTIRLAFRNLLGAGLRTWLNVIVLSFSFVAIIFTQGLLQGTNRQIADAMITSEYGGGQYWHEKYDPYDPLSLTEAHGRLPDELMSLVAGGHATPVLIVSGTIYVRGRMRNVLLKGIHPEQTVIALPSRFLAVRDEFLPALVGSRMAQSTGLKVGDYVTLQWRDAHGVFDACEARIVQVMTTSVPTIDQNQLWLPLSQLQALAGMPGEATIVIVDRSLRNPHAVAGWQFRSLDFLLRDIHDVIRSKSIGSSVFYVILLALALLAIFDTQVLSIFRRRREIGTLMALGMTRGGVIRLFTVEGALYGVLAAMVAAAYGIPLLTYAARTGLAMPAATQDMGYAIGEKLFPAYGAGLVAGTTLLVLIATTIVSFLPTRRIARLKPTDALRGRLT